VARLIIIKSLNLIDISGSHGGEYEDESLLGYGTM
jgi:hypothetical protein